MSALSFWWARGSRRATVAAGALSLPSTDLPLQTSIALTTQRLDGIAGAATSAGGIPLQKGRLYPGGLAPSDNYNVTKKTFKVVINGVEQAIFAQGLGRYDDGSYRSLYLEFAFGSDVTVAKTGTLTFNTTRTTTDIAATVLDATWGFSDPVTHLPVGGTTATGWMKNPANIGRNSVVVAPSDPLYLAPLFHVLPRTLVGTTANSDWTAQGTEVMAPTFGTKTFAQQATTFGSNFDTYLKTGGFSMWDKVDGYAFTQGTILNATFYGSVDCTNAAADPGAAGTPTYFNWRQQMGSSHEAGLNFQYYDNGLIHFDMWAATGDLEFYKRACAYTWCYRYYKRWLTDTGAISPFPDGATSKIHESCPEGMARHYLLTGDPESLYGIQAQAARVDTTAIAKDDFYMGEPRPIGRGLAIIRCAWEASTSANESQSWQTALNTVLDRICVSGTSRYAATNALGRTGLTFRDAPVNFLGGVQYCGGAGSNTFVTPFQHTIIMDALWRAYYRASLTETQRSLIRTTMIQMADALYPDYFRGDNELYVTPRVACFIDADGSLNYPGVVNILPCQMLSNYLLAGGTGISPYVDSANMFPSAYAAAAKLAFLHGDTVRAGEYRALAERFFVAAVGTTAGGELGPNLDGGTSSSYKARKEQYCFAQTLFYHLATGPAKGSLASDVTVYMTVSPTTANGPPLGTTTITARPRNRTHFPNGRPVTWSTSNALIATVDATGLVTYVAAGNCNITATADGLAASCAVTVAAAQLIEDWSSLSIRSTIWDALTNKSGTGAASAATGKLIVSTTSGGAGNIEVVNPGSSVNRYSLTTANALTSGFVADIQSMTAPANVLFAIQDSTGVGFAFRNSASGTLDLGRLTAGAGTINSRFTVSASTTYSPTNHRYLRFKYDGSANLMLEASANNASWTTLTTLANSGPMTVTAVGICFAINSGSSDNSMTIGTVVAN